MNTPKQAAFPRTGIPGLIENWRSDVLSGFLVFLIALPLCLGIALASGLPPMGGIITAIVGGVLVSRISGSFVTINGPAAGLIVVIIDAVESLGQGDAMAGYRYTLAAIVISSAFQLLLGVFKSGKLSAFFPTSVVHGMLAAIGIIIMAKQIHTLVGVKPEAKSLFGVIFEIPHSLLNMNPEIFIIGVSGFVLLILWTVIKNPLFKMIPAPILGVLATDLLIGVGIGIVVEFMIHLSRGLKLRNMFSMAYNVCQTDEQTYNIGVSGAAVFSNIISLKSMVIELPRRKTIFFDLADSDLIDHTVMEFIHHFAEDYEQAGGTCKIIGLDNHKAYSKHDLAARRKKFL
ncbi:MAG: SulP family inorganic anion transporter [Methylococcales bacterium]